MFRRSAVALVAAALGAAAPAAGDITPIKLTESGPDQAIDLTSSFYLTGTAARDEKDTSVVAVHAIFVKAADPALGFVGRASCDALSHALSPHPGLATKSVDARVGRVPVGNIWPAPPDAPEKASPETGKPSPEQIALYAEAKRTYACHKNDEAYVPAPWFKADNADQKNFKILVSQPSPSFFHSGATYCMFVYRLKVESQDIDLQPAMAIVIKPLDSFDRKPGESDADYTKRRTDYLQAIQDRNQRFEKAIVEPISKATGKPVETVLASPDAQNAKDKVNAVSGYLSRVEENPVHLAAFLDIAGKLYVHCTPPSENCPTAGREPPADYQDVRKGFGRILAEALAAAGKLERGNGSNPVFTLGTDGKTKVNFIRLLEEKQGFSVAAAASGANAVPVTVDVKSIAIPQSTLTLQDLLLLARGMTNLPGQPVAFKGLYSDFFSSVMGLQDDGTMLHTRPDTDDARKRSSQWFGEMRDALNEAAQIKEETASSARQFILFEFAKWLEPALVDCKPEYWKDELEEALCSKVKIVSLANAFDQAQRILQEYEIAVKRWEAKAPEAMRSSVLLPARPEGLARLDVSTRFDQKSWLFSYLTPVVGYARVTGTAQSFSTGFIGLQLTLWPNPVNEPMWTNGSRDWKRFFALQLALGTSSGPYGNDGRNQGVDPFGLPVFAGISIQPLPYVSMSMGGALMQTRKSTLPQETTRLNFPFYWSLSAQINVPDLIKQLATPDKSIVGKN